jgi:superfamily I DNA/RNA helicase
MFLFYPEVLADRYGFEYEKLNTGNVSRRVPSEPLSFALGFLRKVRYRDHGKEILPARKGGKVLFMRRNEFIRLILKEGRGRKVVIQERHRHVLEEWKRLLEGVGLPYCVGYDENYKKFRSWDRLMKGEGNSRDLWNVFRDDYFLPAGISYRTFLREKEMHMEDFKRNHLRWISLIRNRNLLNYIRLHPRKPVFLTTMHSQKGEEGDIVWVSGVWTGKVRLSDEERKLYFTACTRTRDILVVDMDGLSNIAKLLRKKGHG